MSGRDDHGETSGGMSGRDDHGETSGGNVLLPNDQLRLCGNKQSGSKTVARCRLCNLYNSTHGFVVISKCTFTSTFTSFTFEK